ncbi:hypothetical protein QBC46DRAFT_381934 [Diplogelasinospora grovesii]|uniref:Zinc metallopeptidase n=1 Tax=Diplogelasinospora grovesii TaxID=303347 RepID=A0AAN6S630_9PEZI|nr:hypothetical protein QBC46DRAFT_381934 [Diplogelasinospora grovesii]
MEINNVIVPGYEPVDIKLKKDGIISSVQPASRSSADPPSLLLPSLCHPHIHLDKAYILTCNHASESEFPGFLLSDLSDVPDHLPDYSTFAPVKGTFQEALEKTAQAKELFNAKDLYLRGSQLLVSSYRYGVTSARCFVEVDHTIGQVAWEAAVNLQHDFHQLIDVQLCVFAQDPIFSGEHGDTNRDVLAHTLVQSNDDSSVFSGCIAALGTTPYVESSRDASLQNIEWAVQKALRYKLHLDFHLDYNLSNTREQVPLAFAVLESLIRNCWVERTSKTKRTVVLGHCTQLTQLSAAELTELAAIIKRDQLPVHFVGLPTSDLYMMGRPPEESESLSTSSGSGRGPLQPHIVQRGTLQIPSLIRDYGLNGCLGVNNVGNAFTPFGNGDPLQLACWGVGLYHAGTPSDAELLYGCVSWRARQAIGLQYEDEDGEQQQQQQQQQHQQRYGPLAVGSKCRQMLVLRNSRRNPSPKHSVPTPFASANSLAVIPTRQRLSFKDVVWDPPDVGLRRVMPETRR